MALKNEPGTCPRIGQEITFEMQYEEDADGSIIYKACNCSELICCGEHDETECAWIWYNFFCEHFGLPAMTQEEAAAYYTDQEYYEQYPEGGEYTEGEAPAGEEPAE